MLNTNAVDCAIHIALTISILHLKSFTHLSKFFRIILIMLYLRVRNEWLVYLSVVYVENIFVPG